jgi:hypothetical protein
MIGLRASNRREVLRAGGLTLLGMSLPDLLRAQETRRTGGKAKSVILLYLFGGPSLQETFDPKPDAPPEIRGPFGSIPTSVPGVHFCEYLPGMARWMNRSTLIRSASHDQNDHSAGLLYTMTGSPPEKLESLVPVLSTQPPGMNAVVQYLERDRPGTLPAAVWMPCYPGWGQKILRPGPYAGFLGNRYDPFITGCEITETYKAKDFYDVRTVRGRVVVPGTALQPEITLERFGGRRSLVAQLAAGRRRLEADPAYERFDNHHKQALQILTDGSGSDTPWRAFHIEEEPPAVRRRYGGHLYGEAALLARRLVERGVRFVTVSWESFEKVDADPATWDTHERHFEILKDHRLPELDQVYSALVEDLKERGLLDETLVVVMGEMGRTPRINGKAGRDHWSYCHNVLLTGAGVKHGFVYGASDAHGNRPTSNPVAPGDLIATIYAAMGIDPTGFILDSGGRARPIVPSCRPIEAILA